MRQEYLLGQVILSDVNHLFNTFDSTSKDALHYSI
jgi:hypothetical protein